MKKSILLAAFAVATLIAPVSFANGGVKKQTPVQAAQTDKKQEKATAKIHKKEAKDEQKMANSSKKMHHKKVK